MFKLLCVFVAICGFCMASNANDVDKAEISTQSVCNLDAKLKYKGDMIKIIENAKRKYPENYEMQEYQIKNQIKSYVDLMDLNKKVREM